MTKISIVTPTFNEEENIEKLCLDIKVEMKKLNINYEHIVIDNCSTDKTIDFLKDICRKDKNVKVIVNAKNFGHIKSPFYGILQSSGYHLKDIADPIAQDSAYEKLARLRVENEAELVAEYAATVKHRVSRIEEYLQVAAGILSEIPLSWQDHDAVIAKRVYVDNPKFMKIVKKGLKSY